MSSSSFAPASGEPGSSADNSTNFTLSAAHAASTAGPTLLVSHEPPLTGACGNSESPSSKRTLPVPTPIAAAAIWVMPV